MKALAIQVGIAILVFLMKSEAVHAELRKLAKKTKNTFDDMGVEAVIALLKKLSGTLGKK